MKHVTFFSQADDICNEANELLRIRDYLYNELSKKTGQPFEKVSFLFPSILLVDSFCELDLLLDMLLATT